ncbi:MAG: ComEA family DNA-binding protein, partial [Bacteroidia bacterium]
RNALYNYHQFSGKELINYGIDFSFTHRNYVVFGEAGGSDNGGNAILAGIMASIDPRANVGLLYRNYASDFHALSGNSIAESSNNNEKGTYLALSIKPAKSWTLSAYYDIFSFPWLKYLVDAPSKGYEYIAQLNYRPSRRLDMYFRTKMTHKEVNVTGDPAPIDYLVERDQRSYRFHVSYKVSTSFTLRSRVELSHYRKANEPASEGYLIYQDVSYKGLSSPFTFSVRYLLFDTDDYNSRIYAYENDVLYAYSIPGFFYRGSRFYVVTKYRVMRGIEVWLRYANTFYSNRNTVGSGLDLIQGSNKSEVKAQLRLTF